MVALGPGDRIVANFGQSTVPLQYSDGRDREYQADVEIESESYRIAAWPQAIR